MKRCSEAKRIEKVVTGLSREEIDFLLNDWLLWARTEQLPPVGDWITWLFLGGRGAGKTRAGAEWVKGMVFGKKPFATKPVKRIALIGATMIDARKVMVEGVSGLLHVHNDRDCPKWLPSKNELIWPNGASAQVLSAENPEGLRGYQFEAAWCDEFCKWRYVEQTFNMLQFALRLGDHPRQLITSTPRPLPIIKKLIADKSVVITKSSTYDNAINLAPGYLKTVVKRYHGSAMGRQELNGDIIEDRKDALWHRPVIDNYRLCNAPDNLVRTVVAVDPPATSNHTSNACGIVAVAMDNNKKFYVLADVSMHKASPMQWAKKALNIYKTLKADYLIAEVNQGGEMVTAIFASISSDIMVRSVRAKKGKYLRAEPVAALYEQGRVSHVGTFAKLEDEMCEFGNDGLANGKSPDRLDALVWGITYLMSANSKRLPNIRHI